MAKVVITVQDDGESVDMKTEFDPPLNTKDGIVPTDAQSLALLMLKHGMTHCRGGADSDE